MLLATPPRQPSTNALIRRRLASGCGDSLERCDRGCDNGGLEHVALCEELGQLREIGRDDSPVVWVEGTAGEIEDGGDGGGECAEDAIE